MKENKKKILPMCGMIGLKKTMKKPRRIKAKIYQGREEIILSGEVVSFFLGTEGWNLVMKGSRVVEEHPDLFETILDLNNDKMLKGEWGKETKSKAEINGDTIWLGFRIDSGVRVRIYNTRKER